MVTTAELFRFSTNHPADLICELGRLFYTNNWLTGTGGGISIRDLDGPNPNVVFISPSGIQKERLTPREMFAVELPGKTLYWPTTLPNGNPLSRDLAASFKYKPLACTPLFLSIYRMRDAGACIHTHSQNAVLATLIWEDCSEIRMNNMEQIKALPRLALNPLTNKVEKVGSLHNHETMVIPIVDNTPEEEDLTDMLEQTLAKYPEATAILVRRHGIHVWGETVWKAKIYNEAIDYLLEMAIKMHQHGIPLIKE